MLEALAAVVLIALMLVPLVNMGVGLVAGFMLGGILGAAVGFFIGFLITAFVADVR